MLNAVERHESTALHVVGSLRPQVTAFLIAGLVVAICCSVGIATRPMEYFASFWPANAVLLAMMLRWPNVALAGGWAGAASAYFLVDLAAGTDLDKNLWLNSVNLVAVAVAFALLGYRPMVDWRQAGFRSVVFATAAITTAVVVESLIAKLSGMYIFREHYTGEYRTWFASEICAMAVLVPPIVSFPGWASTGVRFRHALNNLNYLDLCTVGSLAGSLTIAAVVGGPGAIAIPVPALIFCGLRYSIFFVALITGFVCCAALVAISSDFWSNIATDPTNSDLDSVRLGISALAVAPITVVCMYRERMGLIDRLELASTRDYLTVAFTRTALMERGAEVVAKLRETGRPLGFLMIDIDHFKLVNDTHGHVAGDRVLIEFAKTVRAQIPESALFGRFGGEEFAVLLPDHDHAQTVSVAMRIRAQVERARFYPTAELELSITVSVGLAHAPSLRSASLDSMMSLADRALYRAKESGRNQVYISEDHSTE